MKTFRLDDPCPSCKTNAWVMKSKRVDYGRSSSLDIAVVSYTYTFACQGSVDGKPCTNVKCFTSKIDLCPDDKP